jgi:hypothetical protein
VLRAGLLTNKHVQRELVSVYLLLDSTVLLSASSVTSMFSTAVQQALLLCNATWCSQQKQLLRSALMLSLLLQLRRAAMQLTAQRGANV